jgi:nucleotide-binding universal stress UspA family protein
MNDFEQIVVALGEPDADASLIGYAALLATLGGAREVRFAHVVESSADAALLRRQLRDRVAGAFQGSSARIECDVLQGSLTDRLLDYVTEFQADLLLVGAERHKLGARLAMVAPCSLAIVPNGHAAGLSHLLIAVDFSDAASWTLQWATSLAASDRTIRCTALHVITRESTDLFAGGESEPEQARRMRDILSEANRHGVPVDARLVAAERSGEVGLSHPFSLAASIEGADVAHTILAEAEACGADCIALSTRGRSRSASILLGSVTEKVIERSSLPLLIGKQARHIGLASILLGRAAAHVGIKTN